MQIWIWVTILAVIFQSMRTAQSKNLKPLIGDFGASYIRFSYAIPFSWLFIFTYSYISNQSLPSVNLIFFFWVTIAGITQIIFTVLLITLFSHRSFAAATAFSKTEVIQAALFEGLIIGYFVNARVGFAIILGVIALFLLSLAKTKLSFLNLLKSLITRQALLGLGSGAFLGFCTVAFRVATDSLEGTDLIMKATFTGGVSVLIQSILMGLWMLKYSKNEFVNSFTEWKKAYPVGFYGAASTVCWFYAFSANAVAPVRALGQIELIIALAVSFFYFREKPTIREISAIILLIISILMVIIFS